MDQGSREKLTNTLSVIIRTSALVVGIMILFAGGYALEYQNQNRNKPDISASVLETSSLQNTVEILLDAIQKKDMDALREILPSSIGAQKFLLDASSWEIIQKIHAEIVGNGIFMSLLASTNGGDVLHPYFGYFTAKDGKISEVFWGETGSGTIESLRESPFEGYFAISLKNTGQYPWLETDSWRNKATNEEVMLFSEENKKYVEKGEGAILIFKESDSLLLHNQNRGFDVLLDKK